MRNRVKRACAAVAAVLVVGGLVTVSAHLRPADLALAAEPVSADDRSEANRPAAPPAAISQAPFIPAHASWQALFMAARH